jgi:Zn-dependent metalloprotease
LEKLLESKDREVRRYAMNTLLATAQLRGERLLQSTLGLAALASGDGRRTVFDCRNSSVLSSAAVVRTENGPPSTDISVNRAFEGLGMTREFFSDVFGRNSIDDKGMRLDGYVHFGFQYNNAFWDGRRMVFGDGDGLRFVDFTMSLDVIAHELTHGVTENSAGLEYHNQPGALNESMSDVFGSLVKQWSLGQSTEEADWLIGADIFTPGVDADALRSLKAPGTAYNNDEFGKDPQPDHMSKFAQLPDTPQGDHGGVHINSGIPNKAFYLTAVEIGGSAWEAPGHIWYESLKASNVKTQFQEFADTTYLLAGQLYGYAEQQAVLGAWREVGIRISGVVSQAATARRVKAHQQATGGKAYGDDSLAALTRQIESLAAQVETLSKTVTGLRDAA